MSNQIKQSYQNHLTLVVNFSHYFFNEPQNFLIHSKMGAQKFTHDHSLNYQVK